MKETKELFKLLIGVFNWAGEAVEDGTITWPELISLFQLYPEAKDAIDGIKKLPEEYRNMSDEDKAELLEYIKSEFDIPQDVIEKVIEAIFDVLFKIEKIISDLIEFKK